MADNFALPTDPDVIKKIKKSVQEGSAATQLVEDRKEHLKEIITYMNEEFGLPKKLAGAMIRTHFKQNYKEVEKEATTFQVLYENVMGSDTD